MQNSRPQLLEWAESEQINEANIEQAVQIAEANPTATEWQDFLKATLLWSATIALCAGVIFFFAYNWHALSRFTKFALVESSILIATLAYIRFTITKRLTSATLMAMSLLIGALLALVGQTYQTGADPWQLFATWSLLILPWVVISRASSLWILWMVLVNLSLSLYFDVTDRLFGILLSEEISLWIFTLVNTSLLCLFETLSLLKKPFCEHRYLNQLSALFAGSSVTLLGIWAIFEHNMGICGLMFYVAWIAIAFYIYRHKRHDLFILSMGTLSVIIILNSLLIKLIDNSMDDGGFLLVSLSIIGSSTYAGIWLKGLSHEFSPSSKIKDSSADSKEVI